MQELQNKSSPQVPPRPSERVGRLGLSVQSNSWRMGPGCNTFRHLWRNHGPFQVDLFSNRYNAQLETFISPYPDPLAAGENAFSLDWNQWVSLYAFPPTKVLPLVVQRLHHFRGQGVLIAPYHPISTWFPSLMIRCPLHYPLLPSLRLSQTIAGGTVTHPNSHAFSLHAWIL